MRARWAIPALVAVAVVVVASPPAGAQTCGRGVIVTMPGVTWEEVARVDPPHLLELVREGAAGSVSVRTNSSRTTYPSGFATLGAGTRMDVPPGAAQPYGGQDSGFGRVTVPGVDDIDALAEEEGYSLAQPGALGTAVASDGATRAGGVVAIGNGDPGRPPPAPLGFARYALLTAMDDSGRVASASTGTDLTTDAADAPFGVRTDPVALHDAVGTALEDPCAVVVVDDGDLVRADRAAAGAGEVQAYASDRRAALLAADDLIGLVRDELDPARDLLVVVAPTSPGADDDVHFGIAVAVGPGFTAGESLGSPATRRPGIVTLPDVAPTVLDHLGIARPTSMLGRPWFSEPGPAPADLIAEAIDLDREAVFIDRIRTPVSTGFVLFQLLVYAVAVWVLTRARSRRGDHRPWTEKALHNAALYLAAFPVGTYLAGVVQGHELGWAGYTALLMAIAATIVVVVDVLVPDTLDRLLVVAGLTLTTLVIDLIVGAPLQLNTVFSYSPIVAGRFAGLGNIGFAVLSAASLLTGALLVHRFGSSRRTLTLVGVLFALTVLVDGAPQFGSDVGGAIALVPGLGIAWLLLAGRRPSVRATALAFAGGIVVLALFLAIDLSRPEDSQTHLARLFQDVRSGGGEVFRDAILRKVRTNLRVLGSTIWTFVVPPALGLLAWLLLRPRWQWLSRTYPKVRAGLVGGLVMAVLGYAVNDSGIVIPAMMFSYLVPVAVAPLAAAPAIREEP
ncbi:MAG TPA: hypothetical protein VJ927_12555 [Actinomycetota bacterium]|nr:hypothetical protein [Actinomycetota bacterium]